MKYFTGVFHYGRLINNYEVEANSEHEASKKAMNLALKEMRAYVNLSEIESQPDVSCALRRLPGSDSQSNAKTAVFAVGVESLGMYLDRYEFHVRLSWIA